MDQRTGQTEAPISIGNTEFYPNKLGQRLIGIAFLAGGAAVVGVLLFLRQRYDQAGVFESAFRVGLIDNVCIPAAVGILGLCGIAQFLPGKKS